MRGREPGRGPAKLGLGSILGVGMFVLVALGVVVGFYLLFELGPVIALLVFYLGYLLLQLRRRSAAGSAR